MAIMGNLFGRSPIRPMQEHMRASVECARQILRGVERKKATIVVTKLAKFFWLLNRFAPGLTMWLMKKQFDKFRATQADR